MNLKPYNRHLILDLQDDADDDEPTILLPEEYKPKQPFAMAKILAISDDCKSTDGLKVGDTILCNNSMVEEVKIKGETYYLLLENYVLCLVS